MIRQYSKVRPRLTSSRRSASTSSCLVTPGACAGDDREHRIDDEIGRNPQGFQFLWRLDRAQAFERQLRLDELACGSPARSTLSASAGRKARSMPIRFAFGAERRELLDRQLHPVGAGARGGLNVGTQNRPSSRSYRSIGWPI